MKKITYFDKRYTHPVSFDGELFFTTQINKKGINIYKSIDREEKQIYIIVYFGKNNTEIYKEYDLFKIFKYFDKDENKILELMKKFNLIEKYESKTLEDSKYFFKENYSLHLYEVDSKQILIVKSKKIYYLLPSDVLNSDALTIPSYALKQLKSIKYHGLNYMRSRFKKNSPSEEYILYLNKSSEGAQVYDTGISSIEDKKKIFLYGNKIYHSRDEENYYTIIISNNSYYLIINDTIYKDIVLDRLLLKLPEGIYLEIIRKIYPDLSLDKKYHILLNNLEKELNLEFHENTYQEIALPYDCTKNPIIKFNGNSCSELLEKSYQMVINSLNLQYNTNWEICDKETKDYIVEYKKYISTESHPIITKEKPIYTEKINKTTYHLIDAQSFYIVLTESQKENNFYIVPNQRILFHLIYEKKLPINLNNLLKSNNTLHTLSIDRLGEVRYVEGSN